MGIFVANKLVKLFNPKNHMISKSKIYVLGVIFKEDYFDIRNSKVIDIVSELKEYYIFVEVEQLIKKKIRIALFGIDEFKKEHLDGVEVMLKMYG